MRNAYGSLPRSARAGLGNEGVALPLALLGLVLVSLLITAALVAASTESAMSGAHQDATQAVYAADAALEGYVAQQSKFTGSTKLEAGNTAFDKFNIQVSQLTRETFPPSTGPNGSTTTTLVRERFGVVAQPTNGRGRSVGAMVSTERTFKPLVTNINSGATFTSGFDISGSSIVSGKRDTNLCTEGTDQNAVTYSNDVPAGKANCDSKNCDGAVEKAPNMTGAQLIQHVLGGVTLDEVKSYASIKFGYDGKPLYESNKEPSVAQTDLNYNWGCPAKLVPSTCATSTYKDRYPVVVIQVPNGKKASLTGGYGQGILYVDGDLDISGRFVYDGIVIVTGKTDITGSGSDGMQIQGSFLGLGTVSVDKKESDDTKITGKARIQYNKCSINQAEKALSQAAAGNAPQNVAARTYNWFELMR